MPKVKICGITNLEDALVAAQAGADFLGFIFYEPSPRYVAPEIVREIVSGVRGQAPGNLDHALPRFVGVFVNASLEVVGDTLDYCQLDAAQLHGEESPEFVNYFQGRAFKALRPQSLAEAEHLINKYLPSSLILTPRFLTPYFLLDAYHPTLYGGTGQVTDWTIAAAIAQKYPIMLAGSLTPTNVVEAIQAVRPWGIDVSSGVEADKGKKDHEKVRALVKAAKDLK
ncbi:MAG: phosphoribosylanthranilate isomerase [Anaerolineae bacterium]|nr:phosphoribosylanthranilate isomerase [Anaerolineae bacterium]